MKKTTLLLLLLMVCSVTYSQEKEKLSDIPKGYQFVKASINFSNSSTADTKANYQSMVFLLLLT